MVACEFSRLSSLLAADVTTGGRFGGGETTVLYSKAKWAVESRGSTELILLYSLSWNFLPQLLRPDIVV